MRDVDARDEDENEDSDGGDEQTLSLQGRQTTFLLNRHVVHRMLPSVRSVA